MADFLQLAGKRILVMGLSNRRSVAWAVGRTLEEAGARVTYVVRNTQRRKDLDALLGERECLTCDVEDPADIRLLAQQLHPVKPLHGFVHSIAYANFQDGPRPFHETPRADFLQAAHISAFSLVELTNALRPALAPDASIVTMGISSSVTAANYGYLSPIKNALEGCVRFLAKSLSAVSQVRVNSVNAGPLKTKSSAGIPGYLENYLFAEKLTFRKRAVDTQEVANTCAFLLSPRSSGINGQGIVVNAGMDWNYFDEEVVRAATRP